MCKLNKLILYIYYIHFFLIFFVISAFDVTFFLYLLYMLYIRVYWKCLIVYTHLYIYFLNEQNVLNENKNNYEEYKL